MKKKDPLIPTRPTNEEIDALLKDFGGADSIDPFNSAKFLALAFHAGHRVTLAIVPPAGKLPWAKVALWCDDCRVVLHTWP